MLLGPIHLRKFWRRSAVRIDSDNGPQVVLDQLRSFATRYELPSPRKEGRANGINGEPVVAEDMFVKRREVHEGSGDNCHAYKYEDAHE